MSKIYTYDAWIEEFKPIKNPNNDWGGEYSSFETYTPDATFVWEQPDNTVWTEVDGDSGTYIIAGKHLVNRIHYFITTNPWTDDMTEVPTWVYRDCDCVGDAYYGNTDCTDCEGEGTVEVSVDTVEDLKAIYGEDAEIIG